MSAIDSKLSDARLQIKPADANRLSIVFGLLGVLGIGATGLGLLGAETRLATLTSYLVAFVFVATIAVGGMFFAMLQHLVGARWSVPLRRIAENFGAPLWLILLLFIPIAVNVPTLFHEWAGGHELEAIVAAKTAYLNVPFFLARSVTYLVAWAVLGFLVYRYSVQLDQTGDPNLVRKLRRMAPPGVLIFGITLSFAGFDWLMSLDPTWASTMFGVYTFAGSMISSLCAIALSARILQSRGYLKGILNEEHFHDIGKLMLGFTVFWAYIAFSQYFLIWYANIPEETIWFRKHWTYADMGSDWSTVTMSLVFLHFVIPFFANLSRHAKRNATAMTLIASLLIVMHYVDVFWIVMPLFRKTASFIWSDATALCGIAGLYMAALLRRFGAAPLIPIKDPFLQDSLEYDNG